ncbi:MAG: histidinol dehydrogenase [Bacteroidetes bacterium]|nr:histidinol dehydrogenase [Bacteroidota bacterium]
MIRLITPEQWTRVPVTLDAKLEQSVAQMLNRVATQGDGALRDYTLTFDSVDLASIAVPVSALESAWNHASSAWKQAFRNAADNIRRFHQKQCRQSWYVDDGDGVRLGQRILPVDSAGLYIPGGTAAYPSSVLMTAIPAQVAGVSNIYITSPPDPSTGLPRREVLATAHMLKVHDVFSVGGAQAIAAFAYGTQSMPKVDKIVGPGSTYVTMAKKLVYGHVDIDSLAGPSELVVLADSTSNPVWIAHDLIAQAEHDPLASAMLVTHEDSVAQAVCKALEDLVPQTDRKETVVKALTTQGAAITTASRKDAVEMVNTIAPEHLELMVQDPWEVLEDIRHAGAVFMGPWSPEPVGDYYAGPNHVLPTGGAARFSSALGVEDFQRSQSVIGYSQRRLSLVANDIALMAQSEGLDGHARSVQIRNSN